VLLFVGVPLFVWTTAEPLFVWVPLVVWTHAAPLFVWVPSLVVLGERVHLFVVLGEPLFFVYPVFGVWWWWDEHLILSQA
jgi:hypothetical protein